MDITDEDRKRIGQVVEIRRRANFGTKSNAYRQAGLNAATWDRIETGSAVRDDRLAAALKLLWPDSGGDWRKAIAEMDDRTARIVEPRYPIFGGSWADPEYLANIEEWIEEMQGRIEVLEAAVLKGEDDADSSAPKNRAPASGADEAGPTTPRVTETNSETLHGDVEAHSRPRSDGPRADR